MFALKKKIPFQLDVMDEGVFHYGQRLYIIRTIDHKLYTGKCPVCDNTRKITVKGYEMDCPYCSCDPQHADYSILLKNYKPIEYIINEITIKGEAVKNAYTKDGNPQVGRIPVVVYNGFAKIGNTTEKRRFCVHDLAARDLRPTSPSDNLTDFVFDTRSQALAVTRCLHEKQKAILSDFNKQQGTNYEYPFEY